LRLRRLFRHVEPVHVGVELDVKTLFRFRFGHDWTLLE
jgi:hypothetical protein